jgi:xylan 1,4-beta-xylosidase
MGGLALFTKSTIPQPSFRAFELLDRLVGRRVPCESSNDPVGGLACVSPDRKRAWVMLYNLIEKYTHDPYTTTVTVKLTGLPAGHWRCMATAIAPGGCDPFPVWEKMGKPEKLTEEQRATLLQASELPPAQPLPVEGDSIRLAVPGFSVVLLELTRGGQ